MSRVAKPQRPIDPATGEQWSPMDQPGYYPGFETITQQSYWDAATRKVVLARLKPPPPIRFFTADEAETLLAVTARILPQDDRSESRRIPILPHIDERFFMNRIEGYRYEDMPPDGEAYRIAVKAVEEMASIYCGQRFARLSITQQEEILKSIHDAKPLAAEDLWKQMNIERFWTMLLTDCASAYYAHPWAWDEIGFGGPAYPRGYMRLEDGEAEPWEVNEVRYAWLAPQDTLSGTEEHSTGSEQQMGPEQGETH